MGTFSTECQAGGLGVGDTVSHFEYDGPLRFRCDRLDHVTPAFLEGPAATFFTVEDDAALQHHGKAPGVVRRCRCAMCMRERRVVCGG